MEVKEDMKNHILVCKFVISLIAEKYNVSRVYLFGSYARGEADEESDID